MDQYAQLLSLVVIVAAFYLLLIRPQQKRQKEHQALVNALAPGDRVVSAGGMYGTVRAIVEDRISVEVAPGVVVEFSRQAIAQKVVEQGPVV